MKDDAGQPEPGAGLAAQIGQLLRARHLTLATAESCTGGLIADLITDVAGSSDYYLGGVVSYAYSAKEGILGVRHETLLAHGAVSAETAAELAWGARRLFRADVAVSVTGIAGPSGATPGKPVGLVYLHLSADDAELPEHHVWDGDRVTNKQMSANAALRLVLRHLTGEPAQPAAGASAGPAPQFVAEPVVVESHFLPDGHLQPDSFRWRGQIIRVADRGRAWDEDSEGVTWRCFLVRDAGQDTYELRFDETGGSWLLARTWLRERRA